MLPTACLMHGTHAASHVIAVRSTVRRGDERRGARRGGEPGDPTAATQKPGISAVSMQHCQRRQHDLQTTVDHAAACLVWMPTAALMQQRGMPVQNCCNCAEVNFNILCVS
jgi:hypothetical protein